MAVSFEDAVNTLKDMFQEWDKESLSEIIKAHDGNMDAAVGAILSMESSGQEQSDPTQAPTYDSDAQLARSLAQEPDTPPPVPSAPTGTAATAQTSNRRGRRVALPDDFLRVKGLPTNYAASGYVPQMTEDERLALMLQNEMFLRQLETDPEFANLAGGHRRVYQGSTGRPGLQRQESSIQDKLKNMGEGMKKRLNEMALKFRKQSPNRDEDYGSTVPLVQRSDSDDIETEVVNFNNDSAAMQRRGQTSSAAGGGLQMEGAAQGYYEEEEESLVDSRTKKNI